MFVSEIFNFLLYCAGFLEVNLHLLIWPAVKSVCYTSQLKYVFQLEENVSYAMGQNSLTP